MVQRPLIELLAGRVCPELAAAVRDRIPAIIERWEHLVRGALPQTERLTPPQLRDDAPRVLEQIAKALESDEPRNTEALVEMTSEHGQTRFSQNFNLHELLIEYNLLRAAVLGDVADHLGRPMSVAELVSLNIALDVMTRRSVLEFVEHQAAELKAATEAQSKYLSFLSHDIRGGLNGVFLMIEVLKRELSTEPHLNETVNDLDAMRRSLLETVSTMDRFLHAERFRRGKFEIKPGRIHIRHLLNEIVSQFAYTAADKGISLRVDADDRCVVTSDRELLSLVLQNLLSNAVKFTEKGEIVVTAAGEPNGGCVVSVRDQGPGIPLDRLAQLFQPFTRGETHGKPGVGLGLSIARQAAEYLGAKLWAESEPGRSSTFRISLPENISGATR